MDNIVYVYFNLTPIDGPYFLSFPEGEEAKPKKFGSIVRRGDNSERKVCVNFVFEDGRIKEKMAFEPVPVAVVDRLVAMLS
ncbi:hypothetical protein [Alicyclobacillus sendaiensis]|uniref:hypothetical protein n=1 Tax=Alicyclobacillus sendaiensis TaxID=192387 RepID=UPI0026F42BB4|nr:hypothetical protein [Alicyclobacillus sendaiensis]